MRRSRKAVSRKRLRGFESHPLRQSSIQEKQTQKSFEIRNNNIVQKLLLGIDEAGRGCVIGPLVLAGFLIEDRDEIIERLNDMGVNDSKLLIPRRRDELCREIMQVSQTFRIIKIRPQELNSASINSLEIKYSSRIIDFLKPHTVYLDVPARGVGIRSYCDKVRNSCLRPSIEIIGGNKMDSKNVLVAAASILAKTEREKTIGRLKKKYGDFGSGYTSDAKTIMWLKKWYKDNGSWPSIVRIKWKTLGKPGFQF